MLKGNMLTSIMWKITDLGSLCKLTDPIDIILLILNLKFANQAIFLLN